jgi:hypothetical protein
VICGWMIGDEVGLFPQACGPLSRFLPPDWPRIAATSGWPHFGRFDIHVTISNMHIRHNTTCYQDDQLGVGVQQQWSASTDQVLHSTCKHLYSHISFPISSYILLTRTRPSNNASYPRFLLSSPHAHPPPVTSCPFLHSSHPPAALQHPQLSRTTHHRSSRTDNSLPSTSSSSRHPPSRR